MTNDSAGAPWQQGLMQDVERLGRWFSDRFAIAPGPTDDLLPARSLQDPDTLKAAVLRSASSTLHAPLHGEAEGVQDATEDGDMDVRVAASRFTRHFSASLTAVALVGLSRGVGLDLSSQRCTMIVRHNLPWTVVLDLSEAEIVQCRERPNSWQASGPVVDTMEELRTHVWRTLYAEHLWPVLQMAVSIEKINPGVIWTNAAEWVSLLGESAVEYLGEEAAAPLVAESQALLDAPTLPGVPSDVNPLADRFEQVPGDGRGFPDMVQTRKLCCLTYLLQDRFGRLCQSCPYLPVPERIALVRERHDVPIGGPSGPAEQRAIEVGRARPSSRRLIESTKKRT